MLCYMSPGAKKHGDIGISHPKTLQIKTRAFAMQLCLHLAYVAGIRAEVFVEFGFWAAGCFSWILSLDFSPSFWWEKQESPRQTPAKSTKQKSPTRFCRLARPRRRGANRKTPGDSGCRVPKCSVSGCDLWFRFRGSYEAGMAWAQWPSIARYRETTSAIPPCFRRPRSTYQKVVQAICPLHFFVLMGPFARTLFSRTLLP